MAMRDDQALIVRRGDYRVPAHLLERVDLAFDLDPTRTTVTSTLAVRANPECHASDATGMLWLDGEELELVSIALDGRALGVAEFELRDGGLAIPMPAASATLKIVNRISPAANTELMGLYVSNGNFFTQCEAEGFRRITFFPDRPDVMTRFRVTLRASRASAPVLLANGNLVEHGELADNRHFAVWEDPFAKPSYLFALVAGKFVVNEETNRRASGRDALLQVWVEAGNLDKTAHAMQSLKRAIAWDEQRYGLQLDLDRYMIVASNDFNLAAMENKGLNVFNARYVLANPNVATDTDYAAIEAIIGHEYFHNWTGNRVTCRDWFQLTLKEGLTVFRDQEFSADMALKRGSNAVNRIDDVERLMRLQFAEDAGSLSHPIRPEHYSEINNFYTLTIYEKGAEVVRLYQTLLGIDGFRRGMDLYFKRHDGQAVTCDDFRAAMADANRHDLALMERWYTQAGTPILTVSMQAIGGAVQIQLQQRSNGDPLPLPIRYRLFALDGKALSEERTHLLDSASANVVIENIAEPAVLSVLRGFSAPVILQFPRAIDALKILARCDDDPWARFDAIRTLEKTALRAHLRGDIVSAVSAINALSIVQLALLSDDADPAFAARALKSVDEGALDGDSEQLQIDSVGAALDWARERAGSTLAEAAMARLERVSLELQSPYRLQDAALRSLRSALFGLTHSQPKSRTLAHEVLATADNLTDRLHALKALLRSDPASANAALAQFHDTWEHEPLVLNKWFALQAGCETTGSPEAVTQLMKHRSFTLKNPNRARSVLGPFARDNRRAFHRIDGAGYVLLANAVAELDTFNPQIAARLCEPFGIAPRLDPARRETLRRVLRALRAKVNSNNVIELLDKALA